MAWTDNHRLYKITFPDEITEKTPPTAQQVFDATVFGNEIVEIIVCNENKYPAFIALRNSESCLISVNAMRADESDEY